MTLSDTIVSMHQTFLQYVLMIILHDTAPKRQHHHNGLPRLQHTSHNLSQWLSHANKPDAFPVSLKLELLDVQKRLTL